MTDYYSRAFKDCNKKTVFFQRASIEPLLLELA
jgi:hypothetical protein